MIIKSGNKYLRAITRNGDLFKNPRWTHLAGKAMEADAEMLIHVQAIHNPQAELINPKPMILIFDTETTGLPKDWKAPVTDVDNWPRVMQLGYQVYTLDGQLYSELSVLIRPPMEGFNAHPQATATHGITEELCEKEGRGIDIVSRLFLFHLNRCRYLVSHNMSFDRNVLGAEMIRLGMKAKNKPIPICTKEASTDVVRIPKNWGSGYKWPKLEELHRFLFNEDFEGAHDALDDVKATARCFFELVKRGDITLS